MDDAKLQTPFIDCPSCHGRGVIVFGESARSIRKRANLTLRDVAERMGFSIVYVSDLERGRRRFNGDTTRRFLEACGAGHWLLELCKP